MDVNKDELFKLSLDDLDEDTEKVGWRLLAEDLDKHKEAAELIEEYISINKLSDRWLWFHAGQCWAHLPDEEGRRRAILCFDKSIEPPYQGDSYWYRKASIEYLKSDVEGVRKCLAKLKGVVDVDNLVRIVEFMIRQLEEDGQPNYRKMYESL